MRRLLSITVFAALTGNVVSNEAGAHGLEGKMDSGSEYWMALYKTSRTIAVCNAQYRLMKYDSEKRIQSYATVMEQQSFSLLSDFHGYSEAIELSGAVYETYELSTKYLRGEGHLVDEQICSERIAQLVKLKTEAKSQSKLDEALGKR